MHVEAREPPGAANQEKEAANPAHLADLLDGESVLPGQAAHAPGVGHERRGDAEADDVGEGVELHAEFGGSAGHAGDAAVERIEEDGEADGFGVAIEFIRAATEGGTTAVEPQEKFATWEVLDSETKTTHTSVTRNTRI